MALKKGASPAATLPDETPEVPTEIPRDYWERPLIVPPGGGKPRAYTRASTLGKTIEDTYHLSRWAQRNVALGMSRNSDLVALAAAVRTNEGDDRAALDDIAEQAHRAAGGDRGANVGTALHKLSERSDAGEDLSYLPDDLHEALNMYTARMAPLQVLASETFIVHDDLQAAGTFDRVVTPRDGVELVAPDGTRYEHGRALVLDLKGLALDTPIPTPHGWTTMGAVDVNDVVIGSDGLPCHVTAKSQVKRIGTYVVTFDSGDQITCDREHLWWVLTGEGVKTAREQVIDVEQLRDTLLSNRGQRQHRVPVAEPLDLAASDLPIAPYLFGAWLGDGRVAGGEITKDAALFELLRSDGHETGPDTRRDDSGIETRTVYGLRTALRLAGLLGHRVIPDAYLRGSIEQRTALLRGLMDTDGTWNIARERAQFCTTDKALAEQVAELCITLGLKPQVNSWTAHGFGKTTTAYGVEFLPVGFNPFRLPRKADQVTWTKNQARARHRIVRSVEPGPDVETACIAVDSANNTYLCGLGMIPTHNTGKAESAKYWGAGYAVQQAVYAHGTPYRTGRGRLTWSEALGAAPDGVVAPSSAWALILHVPSDSPADAGLVWVDLEIGAALAELCVEVRNARKVKGLFAECHVTDRASVELEQQGPADWADDASAAVESVIVPPPAVPGGNTKPVPLQVRRALLMAELRQAPDEDALTALWEAADEAVWTEDATRMVRARLAELDTAAVST